MTTLNNIRPGVREAPNHGFRGMMYAAGGGFQWRASCPHHHTTERTAMECARKSIRSLSTSSFIVTQGCLEQGFVHVGPFDSEEAAREEGEAMDAAHWHPEVIELHPPIEL